MKTYDIEFKLRRIIADQTRDYVAHGGKINQLAADTGLAGNTISRIAYNETKHPRMHSIIALLDTLGFDLDVRSRAMEGNVVPIRRQLPRRGK